MSIQPVEIIEADTLRQWLDEAREVVVLDVRPLDQRAEWAIPAITERNTRGHFDESEQAELEAGANRCAVS